MNSGIKAEEAAAKKLSEVMSTLASRRWAKTGKAKRRAAAMKMVQAKRAKRLLRKKGGGA